VTNRSDIHLRLQAFKLFDSGRTVSEVCRLLGRSRTWFYKWRRNWLAEGAEGLKNRRRRCNPHNRTPVPLEEAVLAALDQFPAYGLQRIAHLLERKGTRIGRTAVHGVMKHNHLNRRTEPGQTSLHPGQTPVDQRLHRTDQPNHPGRVPGGTEKDPIPHPAATAGGPRLVHEYLQLQPPPSGLQTKRRYTGREVPPGPKSSLTVNTLTRQYI